MKKIVFLVIMLFMFSISVDAGSRKICHSTTSDGFCDSSDSLNNEFFQFQTEYNKGIQTNSISSSGKIVIYGYSKCNNGNCSYSYVGNTTDYKEVLKKSVKCNNGEKYITFQVSSYAPKDTADDNYTGDMYWNEDYDIVCTNNSSSSTVELSNANSGSSSNGGYNSSTSTENPEQGVETYYIILGLAAIITYVISIVIKKQNLFKKI